MDKQMEGDIYADYDYDINVPSAADISTGDVLGGTVRSSAQSFRPMTNAGFLANGSKVTTSNGGDIRPMTSTSGAGFSTTNGSDSATFDPLKMGQRFTPGHTDRAEKSPEDQSREYEKKVHNLVEESAAAALQGQFNLALEKAKEAGKCERALCKLRDTHGLMDQVNTDLTYAVCFTLANSYYLSKMHDEALHTYSLLVKNKQYPQSGRLRVNIGNIYYKQQKYQSAIKMYRMALDQIPNTGNHVRFKILRNIGNAFFRLGQFADAVQSYETIMGGHPDSHTGFNLILCYYALGDAEKMRRGFQKLVAIPSSMLDSEANENLESPIAKNHDPASETSSMYKRIRSLTSEHQADSLRQELRRRDSITSTHIFMAARLIAPELRAPDDNMYGYKLVIDTLRPDHEKLALQMEIERAHRYMQQDRFDIAVDLLKAFEKKDNDMKAMAATNLSFIYYLEGDIDTAERYADLAYAHDRYNAKALVNKGNCLTTNNDAETAKQFYLEAIGVEADCVEAMYNLGLVNMQLKNYKEALLAFQKLHQIVPNNGEVIYQMAALHETEGDFETALKWYNILASRVPSDPVVLLRMGQIFHRNGDESQALHLHLESYRHMPISLDVISWLGVWYVKLEMYDKAILFFERASQIQRQEVKWRLMVASCYRRMGSYQRALELYKAIHENHPQNAECLRCLIAISRDLAQPYDDYQAQLSRLQGRDATIEDTHQHNMPSSQTKNGSQSENEGIPAAPTTPGSLAKVASTGVEQNGNAPREGGSRSEDFSDADVQDLLPG